MEIRTGILDEATLEKEIGYVTAFFAQRGIAEVLVACGWGCRLTFDELWNYTTVSLPRLAGYVLEGRRADRFYLGESDLLITDPAERCRFLFCHEADIHFEAEPEEVAQVSAHWRREGFDVLI